MSNLIVIPWNAYLLETKFCLHMNYQSLFIKVFLKLAFLNSALTAIKNQKTYYLAPRSIASAGTSDRVSC